MNCISYLFIKLEVEVEMIIIIKVISIFNLKRYFIQLQDVWVVKDRSTHERKGIAYIKFEKASEAHKAMEELHGQVIAGDTKPLKVSLAYYVGILYLLEIFNHHQRIAIFDEFHP